jgi:hypothetical protein
MPAEAPVLDPPVLPPLLPAGAVTLVGGTGDAQRLGSILSWLAGPEDAGAAAGEWWSCLEWTDRLALEERRPALPEDLERLVWGRWFGARGDLEAWRDGDAFRWRFVGEGGIRPALKPGDADAFDPARQGHSDLRVRAAERTALLWPRDDARVAAAPEAALRLLPPRPVPARLRYLEYLDRGTTVAVRYVGVTGQATGRPQSPEA